MEGPVVLHQEFNRSSPDVIHRFRGGDGGFSHALTLFVVNDRARRLFEHLLMTALHAAFPLTQVNRGAVSVRKHLNFHVTCAPQEPFEYTSVAKSRNGFAPCPAYGLIETVGDSTARMPFHHRLRWPSAAGESDTCRGIAHRGQRGCKVCVLIAGGFDFNFLSRDDRNAGFAHGDRAVCPPCVRWRSRRARSKSGRHQ